MIQWILSNIVCHEFEERVGKGWRMKPDRDAMKDPIPAMHIAWGISVHSKEAYDKDGIQRLQSHRIHMMICGPCNYVYVTTQEETIDMDGNQCFGPLDVIGYHDSCWRDTVQTFIQKNKDRLSQARSLTRLMGWWDRIELTMDEVDYLSKVEKWRTEFRSKPYRRPEQPNSFHERWVRS